MKECNSTEFEDQGKIEVGSFIFTVMYFPVSVEQVRTAMGLTSCKNKYLMEAFLTERF